jgi:hypothetical protein
MITFTIFLAIVILASGILYPIFLERKSNKEIKAAIDIARIDENTRLMHEVKELVKLKEENQKIKTEQAC